MMQSMKMRLGSFFYNTLVTSENFTITSTVNEIEITVSVENLAQLLGVPYVGFSDYTSQDWPFVPGWIML